MPTTTGDRVLNSVLNGGYPDGQPILLTGGPGTGKTTLAMQFLQEGLDDGEECLFVSTEQSEDDLRQSFADFSFDLEHDNLNIATVHATPGKTLESDDEELTLETLTENEEGLGGGFTAPFTGEYIEQYLRRFDDSDRIVFDSVSGLQAVADDPSQFRRTLIDIMRLFIDEFDATALLVSEEHRAGAPGETEGFAGSDAVRYNAHGVVRLWREDVDGDLQRFLQINKMRGVDHDTRKFLVEIDSLGVNIVPRRRTPYLDISQEGYLSTGIEGLDDLLGGGLIHGSSAVLEHDGRANRTVIVNTILSTAYQKGWAVAYVPPTDISPNKLRQLFDDRLESMDEMLAEDRLFILDMTGVFDGSIDNVFSYGNNGGRETTREGVMGIIESLSLVADRCDDRPFLHAVNTKSLLNQLDADEIRSLRQWTQANFVGQENVALYVHDPELLPDRLGRYFVDEATQVMRTRLQYGMQFIKLDKAPTSNLGSNRYVEYVEEEPFIRVQQFGGGH